MTNVKMNLYSDTPLGKYLASIGETAYDFEKYARINLATIYKILRGGQVRKDIAKKVIRVTKKHLTLADFGYEL